MVRGRAHCLPRGLCAIGGENRRQRVGKRVELSHFEPTMGQSDTCETLRAMTRNTAQAITPAPENGTVPRRQVPDSERRPREYLPPKEVDRFITAARENRYTPTLRASPSAPAGLAAVIA